MAYYDDVRDESFNRFVTYLLSYLNTDDISRYYNALQHLNLSDNNSTPNESKEYFRLLLKKINELSNSNNFKNINQYQINELTIDFIIKLKDFSYRNTLMDQTVPKLKNYFSKLDLDQLNSLGENEKACIESFISYFNDAVSKIKLDLDELYKTFKYFVDNSPNPPSLPHETDVPSPNIPEI